MVVVSRPEIRVRSWILGHHLEGNGSLEEEEEVNRAEPRWIETVSRILNGLAGDPALLPFMVGQTRIRFKTETTAH
jgi:hypothetical protein